MLRPDLMRAVMRQRPAECQCPGRRMKVYYEHDGVAEGEKPSDRCESCGGRVAVVCVNWVSEWRNG